MTTYRHLSAGNDSMDVQSRVSTSCAKEDENERQRLPFKAHQQDGCKKNVAKAES